MFVWDGKVIRLIAMLEASRADVKLVLTKMCVLWWTSQLMLTTIKTYIEQYCKLLCASVTTYMMYVIEIYTYGTVICVYIYVNIIMKLWVYDVIKYLTVKIHTYTVACSAFNVYVYVLSKITDWQCFII